MSDTTPDMRYQDLIDEALGRIPAIAPEWTDHNPGDPGVTVLELVAWLTETVLYRTTRMTDGERQAFLGLILGADPAPGLRGEALDQATRAAIKAMRAPYRVVTADDYLARLRAGFAQSPEARALGMDGRVAQFGVVAGADQQQLGHGEQLTQAQREAGITVTVLPDDLCWRFDGTLSRAKRTGFWRQTEPVDRMQMWLRDGMIDNEVRAVASNALISRRDGEAPNHYFSIGAEQLGADGELRISPLSTTSGGNLLNKDEDPWRPPIRRLTGSTDGVVGVRWMTLRRPGVLLAVATTDSDRELVLQLRDGGSRNRSQTRGDGIVAMAFSISADHVADPSAAWYLRLFASDLDEGPDTPLSIRWRIMLCETPNPWDAETGGDALTDAVWRWLEPRRMLGTRHDVVGYRWSVFGVAAALYLSAGVTRLDARHRVVDALWQAFAPPPVGPERTPGQPVYLSEVAACLEAVDGVDYVEGLSLSGQDLLTDDAQTFGIKMAIDQLPALDFGASTLTFFERS